MEKESRLLVTKGWGQGEGNECLFGVMKIFWNLMVVVSE